MASLCRKCFGQARQSLLGAGPVSFRLVGLRPLGAVASGSSVQAAAQGVLQQLLQGNKRFVEELANRSQRDESRSVPDLLELFVEQPLTKTQVKAIVCGDAHSFHIASIFDQAPGELAVMRVMGTVMSPEDAMVGSVEFLFEQQSPPLLLVLSQSQNHVVECAVRLAMLQGGRKDAPQLPHEAMTEGLFLVQHVLPAALDALKERPQASFQTLCKLASQLNMWKSIQALLQSSKLIADSVANGNLAVHGAYLNRKTGKVQFLGQHPSEAFLLSARPSAEGMRTASDPPVPSEEALAQLVVGNKRYVAGMGGRVQLHDDNVRYQLSQEGQNPMAVVLGCADSRAPIEILFDMRPGDLFVLRNAGNTVTSGTCNLIGSAEYAVKHLGCKLIVVMGHTQCGAVTAALDTARSGQAADSRTNIGKVLAEIMSSAESAIGCLPKSEKGDQLSLATKLNVHETMKKVIQSSHILSTSIKELDLQIHGAVYDLFSGNVEWLGQPKDMEELLGEELPLHQWKTKPYVRDYTKSPFEGETSARKFLTLLLEGNRRFVQGESTKQSPAEKPTAIIVGGGQTPMSLEKVFDLGEGSVIVQRTMGGIQNTIEKVDTPTASIEYAINRFQPKVLLVLAESNSALVTQALQQIDGAPPPSMPMERVLSDVLVSALRAVKQVNDEGVITTAGRDRKIRQLTVELDALYTIEQLLVSRVIRAAVEKGMELQAAVLNQETGEVDFLGPHPMVDHICERLDSRDRWVNSFSDPL